MLKRFFTTAMFFCCFFVLIQPLAANSNKDLVGTWNITKIETNNPNINALIASNFKETAVEFTKTGTIKISGTETNIKYDAGKSKIKFSSGLAAKLNNPEVSAEIKKNDVKLNVPAELTKQLILMAKEQYLKSGGEAIVAKMIENMALSTPIDASIELKRK